MNSKYKTIIIVLYVERIKLKRCIYLKLDRKVRMMVAREF